MRIYLIWFAQSGAQIIVNNTLNELILVNRCLFRGVQEFDCFELHTLFFKKIFTDRPKSAMAFAVSAA